MTVEARYQQWLADQNTAGVTFTPEQRHWLDAIENLTATSLHCEENDFEAMPFNTIGGLGRAHELFGEQLGIILDELNETLAA